MGTLPIFWLEGSIQSGYSSVGSTIKEILASYKEFLKRNNQKHLSSFEKKEGNNPDGAKFEAAMFSIGQSYGLDIEIGEDSPEGGADFICTRKNNKFALEVTTINTKSIERKTGMKHDQHNVKAGFYSIYRELFSKLKAKVKQVSRYDFPRIVSVGSFHNEAVSLFRPTMADEYLEVFFDRDYIPSESLKDISGILLVAFGYDFYTIFGLLHPEPTYPFNIELLPDIHFRKITKRGFSEKIVEGKWLNAKGITYDPSVSDIHQLKRVRC